MKLSLKIVLCVIVILAYTAKASKRSSNNLRQVPAANKGGTPAAKGAASVNNCASPNGKKTIPRICCHLNFTDEKSKSPGFFSSVWLWGKQSQCVGENNVKAEITKLSKVECGKKSEKTFRRKKIFAITS